ncbi:type I restriction enzyme HsdR N-terminal domain-containing protein [Thiothrix subterranea]|uniref:Type I restriction enzyme HsdR N-terminal domain-containing protein n=1 Tax=Thiothrix subterranea TaxID=2735563 RepID=A0AA51MSH6_9GAMM|nr:type I restriction enzyme HsdR N-terminal domain-containing protein [Thiothrix subterranea]MDQ5770932.1 type I restriction enzyme HsdR N-terminal domain-containing protein [Thiothrix subterranea]WML87632.1 type I restriction enzyme HsdR N-terminal domain-containing protein [Thiothrix subterranea]
MDLIKQGIEKGLISFDDDKKYITYQHQNKRRNYEKPEEKVQVETYCALILEYGYPKHRVQCFVTVPMGVDRKEADIVVYNDDACQEPHILVECKKEDISEPEFKEAINQAYSYAFAMARDIKWVWVTSKIKNTFFQVDKNKQSREIETDIPAYGVDRIAPYKFVKGADTQVRKQGQQKFSELQVVKEDELTRRFKQAHNALWGGGQLNPHTRQLKPLSP